MKTVSTRRRIAAPPNRVWATLTDAVALTNGGAGIRRIDGTIAPGAMFLLYADVAPGRGFKIRVTEWEAPYCMVWQSGQWPVFQGRRTFTLTASGEETDFEMAEVFTGLMLPLIWRSMPDLNPTFAQFADALARMTEGDAI